MFMDKIELKIIGLSYSQTQSGAYALVLSEKQGSRRLPIIIGGFEAQSIAIELENMKPSRPLTHDLFKSFAESFSVDIKEVVIYNLIEGVFYSKLICDRQGVEVDAELGFEILREELLADDFIIEEELANRVTFVSKFDRSIIILEEDKLSVFGFIDKDNLLEDCYKITAVLYKEVECVQVNELTHSLVFVHSLLESIEGIPKINYDFTKEGKMIVFTDSAIGKKIA